MFGGLRRSLFCFIIASLRRGTKTDVAVDKLHRKNMTRSRGVLLRKVLQDMAKSLVIGGRAESSEKWGGGNGSGLYMHIYSRMTGQQIVNNYANIFAIIFNALFSFHFHLAFGLACAE